MDEASFKQFYGEKFITCTSGLYENEFEKRAQMSHHEVFHFHYLLLLYGLLFIEVGEINFESPFLSVLVFILTSRVFQWKNVMQQINDSVKFNSAEFVLQTFSISVLFSFSSSSTVGLT